MTHDDDLTRRLAVTLAQAGDALSDPPADALVVVRRRFSRRRRARRLATALAAAVTVLAATVSAMALRPPPAPVATREGVQMAALTTVGRNQGLVALAAEHGVELRTYSNEAYPEVLAGPLPDVFENWGGAGLAARVAAGRAADLTGALPDANLVFMSCALAGGQVGGRQYGLPVTGTQPVVLFYHKGLFAQAKLQPPRTYADLLAAVDVFRGRGTTPIAFPGGDRWPALMWLMYLADRIGGAKVLIDIAAGRPGAWRNPAVLEAARLTQQLVRRGAFGDGGSATTYGVGTATLTLSQGGAAMYLMGSWEYGNQVAKDPAFAAGDLGWVPFPAVGGGAGDPADLIGVPANYVSVDATSGDRDEAVRFVAETVADDRFLDGLLAAGEVPAIRDLEPRLAGHPHAGFARFVHGLAEAAPGFALAWDQALPEPAAGTVLTEADRLVRLQSTPEEFVAAMAVD